MNEPPVNIPEFWQVPQRVDQMWRLSKGSHATVCELWTHPVGAEIRVTVDGEWHRSQAERDPLKLFDLSNEWRESFVRKGWTP